MAAVCTCIGVGVTGFYATARADEPSTLTVTLGRTPLHAGDRTELVVEIVLATGLDARLALTPSAEGSTLEVVRGRLLSSDARRETDESGRTHLVFAIPVIAHAPGAAVLRVDVDALVCNGACAHVQRSERFPIEVEPASR
jgi:hypothetical protein